jgi:hypothetical protein
MGKCIKIIKDKIDVSKVIKQLKKYPQDWGSQQKLEECRTQRSTYSYYKC